MGSDYKNDSITVCEAIAKPFTPPGDRYGLALTLCSFPRDDQTDMDVDKVTKLLCSMRMAVRVAWEVWEPCKCTGRPQRSTPQCCALETRPVGPGHSLGSRFLLDMGLLSQGSCSTHMWHLIPSITSCRRVSFISQTWRRWRAGHVYNQGIYPRGSLPRIYQETHTVMFAGVQIRAKTQNQPKYPLTGEWTNCGIV